MKAEVECYCGAKADERPVRFRVGSFQHAVEQVLQQWYEPEAAFFRVRADDGNLYLLRHESSLLLDSWDVALVLPERKGQQ